GEVSGRRAGPAPPAGPLTTRFGSRRGAASVLGRSRGGLEPPSSSGLGRRPFKAVTRVRIPLGVRPFHNRDRGPVVQFGVHAGLSSRRPRVQIPSGPPPLRPHPGRSAWSGSSVGRASA